MSFKKGDKVICIDDERHAGASDASEWIRLKLGHVYVIEYATKDQYKPGNFVPAEHVRLKGDEVLSWLASRFVLHKGQTMMNQSFARSVEVQ